MKIQVSRNHLLQSFVFHQKTTMQSEIRWIHNANVCCFFFPIKHTGIHETKSFHQENITADGMEWK